MKRLIQYALTTDLQAESSGKKFGAMAVGILTTSTAKLQEQISRNQQLIETIKSFPDSFYATNPQICGNFDQIVAFLAEATSGEILGSEFGFLAKFLIDHLDILAFRQLLFKLIVNFTLPFCVSTEMMTLLLDQAKQTKSTFNVVFLMRDILNGKPDLGLLLADDHSISTLFQLGVDNYFSSPIISRELFLIVDSINEANPQTNLAKISLSFRLNFDFTSVLNCATSSALMLFPRDLITFIAPFFECRLPTMLNNAVNSLVNRLSPEELTELAEKTHICNLAMTNFDTYREKKTNGHFLDVAMLFSEKGMPCCKAHRKPWKKFAREELTTQYRKVMSNYGGKMNAEVATLQRELFESMDDLYAILGNDDEDVAAEA
jgi:hypothetical protein